MYGVTRLFPAGTRALIPHTIGVFHAISERSSSEDPYSQNQGMPVGLKSRSPALRLWRMFSASSGLFIGPFIGPMYLWARVLTPSPDVIIE